MKKRSVILTTQAHRPMFDDFVDAMREVENREGWRSSEVLRNFLDAAFRSVRGALLRGTPAWDENEAEYMRIVKLCRKDASATMGDLARMLGSLTSALLTEPVDFIGPVFTELSSDQFMGQFFTPYEVSRMMAEMSLNDLSGLLAGRPYVTLCEPACGVGGMALAANMVMRDRGLDVARQAHWHMTDIDHRAMCGAYLQMALTDASAIVCRGDSLANKYWITTPTPAAVLYPKTFATAPAMPPAVPLGPAQLSLF